MVVPNSDWEKNPEGTTKRIRRYVILISLFVTLDIITVSSTLMGYEPSLYILSFLGVMNFWCAVFIIFSEMHGSDTPRYYLLSNEGIHFKIGGGKEKTILWKDIERIFMDGQGVNYWNFFKKDGTNEIMNISQDIGEQIQRRFQSISSSSDRTSYIITPRIKTVSEIQKERKILSSRSKSLTYAALLGIILWCICSIFLYSLATYGYSLSMKLGVIFTGIPGTLLIIHGIIGKLKIRDEKLSLKTNE